MTILFNLSRRLSVEIAWTRRQLTVGGGQLLLRAKREPDVDVVAFDDRRLRHAWLATLEVDKTEVIDGGAATDSMNQAPK